MSNLPVNSSRCCLLVVDDSATIRQQVRDALTTGQLEVLEAEDAETAWETLQNESVSVVLTDLHPTGMCGIDLVKKMKRHFPALPVVLMTQNGSEQVALQALQAGASSYLPKAMLRQELASMIQRQLRATREAARRRGAVEHISGMQLEFQTGNDVAAIHAVTGYIQEQIRLLAFCDEAELTRISTAVHEALINAIEHGNLELDSKLRELEDSSYSCLSHQRMQESPWRDRKVQITLDFTPDRLQFIVKDDGSGFDPQALTDSAADTNQERIGGRGLMLIRSFMDEIWFNSQGNEITLVKYAPQCHSDNPANS